MLFQSLAVVSLAVSGAVAVGPDFGNLGDLTSLIPSSLLSLASADPSSFVDVISSEFATGIPTWLPTAAAESVVNSLSSALGTNTVDISSLVQSLTSEFPVPSELSSVFDSLSSQFPIPTDESSTDSTTGSSSASSTAQTVATSVVSGVTSLVTSTPSHTGNSSTNATATGPHSTVISDGAAVAAATGIAGAGLAGALGLAIFLM